VDEALYACPAVDGVVVGEGEAGLTQLCLGAPEPEVPGLVHRSPSGISRNRAAQTSSLKHATLPDFGSLPLPRYFNPAPVLPVLYSRGCKWRRCRFCAHNSSFAGYRTKAADRCVDELEELVARHGARHFYFADLYVDAPDLEALADRILARRLDIHFHVLGRPTADYTRERLEKMAAAGCRWISWGVESGSQRLLDVAAKGTRVETVTQVLGDAQAAGISNLMMMIFGLPTSTEADLADTFRFLEGAYGCVDAMTASSFALFEDTPFARGASRFGLTVRDRVEELRVDGIPIHSKRLLFAERTADGSLRPPRGPVEVGDWHRRRRWFGDVPFLEGVACEHYLLFVSPRTTGTQVPPVEPPTRKAA
jgi:NAD(P)-dependent dehydrogenase (short-subunit alcohol dehydrogenase family)